MRSEFINCTGGDLHVIVAGETGKKALHNDSKASDWQNNSIGFFKMNINLMPKLHKITCPALFIQGDKDAAVNPKFTTEASNEIQGAKLVVLENHGHWLNR